MNALVSQGDSMKENIQTIHAFWEQLAQSDPLWAILSDPTKKNRQWDLPRFFQTGRREISTLFYHMDHLKIVAIKGKALDFGCGIGRATQALAPYFSSVVGVDISETMIRLADKFNQFPKHVGYIQNQADDLSIFPDQEFDFLYSNIVLQHLQPETIRRYLAEFMRILKPGGLLVFQLPSHLRPKNAIPEATFKPMADDAYQASLLIREIPLHPIGPASELTLDLHIRNTSPHDWIRHFYGPIRIGNHWLTSDGGTMLIQDDGRTLLPEKLAAAAECPLQLLITTPAQKGSFLCEIDLVHEGISWFKDKGCPTVRFPVQVEAEEDLLSAPRITAAKEKPAIPEGPPVTPRLSAEELYADLAKEAGDLESFPMHGIHYERIGEFFRAAGADVLRMEEDEHGGPEWIGYRYIVKKN
jgi:SAM-dependent methyltransferase